MSSTRKKAPARTETVALVTCEHGGNRVPPAYAALFEGFAPLLDSHRGFDPGALETAKALARALDAPLLQSTVTRLLVDLNRETGHRKVFSEATRGLGTTERRRLLERYHAPYRDRVEQQVEDLLEIAPMVVHISSHSFTPVLDGRVRRLDVGLLYDPKRNREVEFCELWKAALERESPDLVVHRNRPYYGTSDGLTRTLRRRLPAPRYLGIELEVNQAFVEKPAEMRRLRGALSRSARDALTQFGGSPGRE